MNNVQTTSTGLKKIFGAVLVMAVSESLNPKKWQAELRQKVTTIYPGVRPNDSLSDPLFDEKEFGQSGQEFTEERVTWIPVPVGTTLEEVKAQLAGYPNARLQRILSLHPILTEEQKATMGGINRKTEEDYRANFVRERSDVEGEPGAPVLYQGYNFYRQIKFRTQAVEDIDLRPSQLKDMGPIAMTNAGQKVIA